MIPWKNGRLLVWDATSPDTLAPSYRYHATSSTGAVATLAAERKSSKYSFLVPSHSFTPVAIESLGPIGRKTLTFLKELSQRVQQRTGEVRAHACLPYAASLRSRPERECDICGWVCGVLFWFGPILGISVIYILFFIDNVFIIIILIFIVFHNFYYCILIFIVIYLFIVLYLFIYFIIH